MPPEHYKKHPHYFKPIADIPTTEHLLEQLKSTPPTPYGCNESQRKYQPSKSPAWRFNLKSTNKNYQKAQAEINERQKPPPTREPINRAKTCTPASTAASEARA